MSQLRRFWVSSGVVAPVLLLLSALPAAGQARVSTIQEAIEGWSPETHLYVFGDVGLPDATLEELEAWLEDRHWTVLLVQDATEQRFQSEEGWLREGVDAIEYGTGQGIARAPGFERDGAVLSIVLAQRALYYTPGPARVSLGQGPDAFQGNLDQWAIPALRNGDVVSAVKDTVTHVDARLAEAGDAEQLSLTEGAIANAEAAEATEAAEAAEAAVVRVERKVAARKGFFILLGLFLLWLLSYLGWQLNRGRLPVKQEAGALLQSGQAALDRKLEALLAEMEGRAERLAGAGFAGETGELIRQVGEDLAALTVLWTNGRAVLEQARERIRPRRPGPFLYNLVFPGNYLRGLALLRDEPAPFDPFRKSFGEVVAELQERQARAAGALDEIEAALRELPLRIDRANERIWQTGLQKEYLAEGAADGLFQVPAVFSALLPAAAAALAEARGTAAGDPVGTWKGSGARADRLAADAWRLVELCRGARSDVMPALQSGETWIGEGLRALSGRAEDLASRALAEPAAIEIEALATDLDGFPKLAGRLGTTRSRLVEEERRVESSRQEMGAALGLAPDLLLREEGSDPSEMLRAAVLQAAETEARLGRGEVGPAAETLESAGRFLSEAVAIVDASRRTFEERETAVAERHAETGRLAALVPEHEAVLAGTREDYAESALGPVGDNAEELQEEIAAARGKLDLAAGGIREGRMLAAADLLGQVRSHQEQAALRMEEITALRARLDQAREDNRGLLVELEPRLVRIGTDLSGDPRITRPTRAVFEEAAGRVRTACGWIDAGREDPLLAWQELLAAREGLERVPALALEDRRLHEEAARQIQEAGARVKEADGWSGPYGVSIAGRPGAAALEAAGNLMRQQRYAEARESALGAWTEADRALSSALAEVMRLRAEEEAEERRRDAARRLSRSSSSSSRSSSSFSSRSSGSSGSSSGSSRSSSGGSRSGSGRSGW